MSTSPAWVHVSWPDENERRTVRRRGNRRAVLGYVRSAGGPQLHDVRYFAETADGLPIEGTFRTRHEAVDAVIASLPAEERYAR